MYVLLNSALKTSLENGKLKSSKLFLRSLTHWAYICSLFLVSIDLWARRSAGARRACKDPIEYPHLYEHGVHDIIRKDNVWGIVLHEDLNELEGSTLSPFNNFPTTGDNMTVSSKTTFCSFCNIHTLLDKRIATLSCTRCTIRQRVANLVAKFWSKSAFIKDTPRTSGGGQSDSGRSSSSWN